MHILSYLVLTGAVIGATPAMATDTAADGAATASVTQTAAGPAMPEAKADPVVCERIKQIGSLLASKKVCMRKSEWEEQRRSDRANIERSQVQRGLQPAG